MPVGTAFHPRTLALCESLNYREWAGYYAPSAYESSHEHEFAAIRNGAALIDVSPLFKYLVTGRDAGRLVDRIVTRDANKVSVGQVIYTPWCDEHGKVIDDGTVARLEDQVWRWTSADPSLRWFRQNAAGLDVQIEEVTEQVAALSVQGPTSARLLAAAAEADIATLKYFRLTRGRIDGVPVEISRTGYTGDLGYESLDAVGSRARRLGPSDVGGPRLRRAADRHAGAGRRAHRSRSAADRRGFPRRTQSPDRSAELHAVRTWPRSPGRGGQGPFVGRDALAAERRRGPARQIVGLEVEWNDVERHFSALGLAPQVPMATSRVAVPVYRGGKQVGRATSTTWSTTVKKLIALATIDRPHFATGTTLEIEITVEAVRLRAGARVVATPFYTPPQKMATPPPGFTA